MARHARVEEKRPGLLGRVFGRGRKDARAPEPAESGVADAVDAPAPAPAEPDLPHGERIEIPHADGSTLRALLFEPETPTSSVPGVLWIHGDDPSHAGGHPAEPAMAVLLAQHRPCVVLCLDHPASIQDCHLALAWLRDNASAHGIATDQLIVGGEGSGSNLAIRLAAYERDEGFVSLCYQLPLYPSLSEGWCSELSGMTQTLGYRGLPPATTIVGMDDFSRDETIAFVEAMRADGVEVDFHMYRGHFSGTGMWADTPETREAKSFLAREFDEAVATWRAPQPRTRDLGLPTID